mmetsp:Transcript_11527/g.29060  ORF Transcript_11527/g.29060 Transcript_11527/m.29060 type:complete len:284 (+) Transcript_11527:2046-2897(+)
MTPEFASSSGEAIVLTTSRQHCDSHARRGLQHGSSSNAFEPGGSTQAAVSISSAPSDLVIRSLIGWRHPIHASSNASMSAVKRMEFACANAVFLSSSACSSSICFVIWAKRSWSHLMSRRFHGTRATDAVPALFTSGDVLSKRTSQRSRRLCQLGTMVWSRNSSKKTERSTRGSPSPDRPGSAEKSMLTALNLSSARSSRTGTGTNGFWRTGKYSMHWCVFSKMYVPRRHSNSVRSPSPGQVRWLAPNKCAWLPYGFFARSLREGWRMTRMFGSSAVVSTMSA